MRAVRAVLALAVLALAVPALAAGAAQADDGSAVRAIGFSADGRYFAYEQYGVRGGDRQLYAEIVGVDVRDDRPEEAPIVETWLPEPDGRMRKGEAPTLAQVRDRAALKAGPTLRRLGIAVPGLAVGEVAESRSGEMLATAHVGAAREAAAGGMPLTLPSGPAARLVLRQIPIDARRCAGRGAEDKPQGLVLTLEREGRTPHTLNHDRNIPVARGCPDRYGLAAAYMAPRADGSTALAVLIQYFFPAAEGPGRRFFAVTSAVR